MRYQDILISVTSFFRNLEAFEALKSKVFPRLVKNRTHHDPVRVWTLGCSTGQEAYSLAIAFAEFTETAGSQVPLHLFATDLNETAIEAARAGVYPKDIAQDVSTERLRRFFVEVNGSYRINKTIRDACVFSRHNMLADPPFSRVDLISCRNLLIYLEPVLQQKIVPILHYALKPAGRAAILRADKEQAPVREESLRVKSNGGYREVAVEVIPVKSSAGDEGTEGGFLVLFEEEKSGEWRVARRKRSPLTTHHSILPTAPACPRSCPPPASTCNR